MGSPDVHYWAHARIGVECRDPQNKFILPGLLRDDLRAALFAEFAGFAW